MRLVSSDGKWYYKRLLALGIPIMLQNLIAIAINLLDTVMIGALGEAQLAAVGAANQIYFIFAVTLFGLYSGSAVYTAQFFGAGDMDGIHKIVGMDYLVGTVGGIALTLIAFIFAPQLIQIYSRDEMVVNFGVEYLRIACFTYPITAFSFAISYNSRAIQKVNGPVVINGIALIINGFLNYALIFGMANVPALGVAGAAIGTLVARIVELLLLLIYVYGNKAHPFNTGLSQLFGFDRTTFKNVMKTAVPVVFTEASWSISTSLIFAAYGLLGTSALAVAQVSSVIVETIGAAYFGVGNATAMSIGEALGAGNVQLGKKCGKYSIIAVLALDVMVAISMMFASPVIAQFYNFSHETQALLIRTLILIGFLFTPKMLGYIFVVGILRAGGDTYFCMKLELFANLLIQLPLAYFSVLVLETSLPVAMLIGELGNVVRIIAGTKRYMSDKWINLVTQQN